MLNKPEESEPKLDKTDEDKQKQNRAGKPTNLVEKDPILKAFVAAHNEEEARKLLEDSDDEKKPSIAVETNIETDNGKINVKMIGLLKSNKKERKFKCTEDNCDETFSTQGKLNIHLQIDHKVRFQCSKCQKFYETANGRDKHYKKHFKYTNICSVCKKAFQFPGQLTVHERSHTTGTAGKFICPTRGCNSVLLSNANLKAHQKIHEEKKFHCDECKKDYSTDIRYKQHMQGKHGNGTITLCGKNYQWADTKYKHEKDCDECQEQKLKNEDKPDFPNPIFRPRRKKQVPVHFYTKCKYKSYYDYFYFNFFHLYCCGEQ